MPETKMEEISISNIVPTNNLAPLNTGAFAGILMVKLWSGTRICRVKQEVYVEWFDKWICKLGTTNIYENNQLYPMYLK